MVGRCGFAGTDRIRASENAGVERQAGYRAETFAQLGSAQGVLRRISEVSCRGLVVASVAFMMLAASGAANGQPESAQGTLEWPSGACYAGELRECKPHGQGIMVFREGSCFVGGFREGKPHGAGIFITRQGMRFSGPRIGHLLARGVELWPARPEWLEPEPEPMCDCVNIKAAIADVFVGTFGVDR